MLLAKIKEKLFNRRNKIEIEDVEVNGDIPASIKSLIQSIASEIDGTSLKAGHYIYDVEVSKYVWVEEIPEDYYGLAFSFEDDGFYITDYNNGTQRYEVFISASGISVDDFLNAKSASLSYDGVNKLDFASLTHSFNELDSTLKQIVDDAIDDGFADGVACTEAQWSAIKALLDKSLYIYCSGFSLIKSYTDGFSNYSFGLATTQQGMTLEINYVDVDNKLYAKIYEV